MPIKKRTKVDVIKEMLISNQDEIWKMEVIRDFHMASDDPKAKVEVDAANEKIKKCEINLTYLNEQLRVHDKVRKA